MTDEIKELLAGAIYDYSASQSKASSERLAGEILDTISAAGFAVVPKEPTDEEIERAKRRIYEGIEYKYPLGTAGYHRAFITALTEKGR